MPKKGEYIRFKNYERKIKSFMIYADFESILVPEDNKKQNPNESYTENIKNMLRAVIVITQYAFIINFSIPFKSYIGKDPVYNFINSMVE